MTYMRSEKGIYGRKGAAMRFVCLLLCALMLLPLLPLPSVSADDPANGDKTDGKAVYQYMLEISSGIVGGDIADYAAIKYTDTDGINRTAIVKTDFENYERTYELAGYSDEFNNNWFYSDFHVTQMPYINGKKVHNGGTALKANSTGQFLFETCFRIDTVQSVDFYLKYIENASAKGMKNEWTLKNFAIYEVESISNARMMGGLSYDTYIPFKGKIVADFVPKNGAGFDLDTTAEGNYIRFGVDKAYPCTINQDFEEGVTRSKLPTDELYISVGFADVYNAGITPYMRYPYDPYCYLYETVYANLLQINVTYEDIYGSVYSVKIPYVFASILYAYNQGINHYSHVYSYAQQGDTLLMKGYFPNFSKLTGFTVIYGAYANSDSVNRKYDVGYYEYDPEAEAARNAGNQAASAGNSIYIENVTIYNDTDPTNFGAYMDEMTLRFRTGNSAIFRYESPTHSGKEIKPCNSQQPENKTSLLSEMVRLVDTDDYSGTVIIPEPERDTVVVEVETDTIGKKFFGEPFYEWYREKDYSGYKLPSVTFNFKYETKDGLVKETGPIDLKEASLDFYGKWPCGDEYNQELYYAYMYLLQEGSKIAFKIKAPDIKKFIDMSISVENMRDESEWQIRRINFYRSEFNPQRTIYRQTTSIYDSFGPESSIYIERDYPTEDLIAQVNRKMLFNKSATNMKVSFSDSDVEVTDETDEYNWDQISKSMTYLQALEDLGFIKPRNQYEVTVDVASNAYADEIDGDSGSNNKFYFQLIFEKGKSGYVQANQQLTADGFRAGKKETFYIKTNRDYGNLKAIHIIPDDMLDDADIYDKLNIESMTVIKTDDGGYNRSWKFDNVGWINIDFHDSGERSTVQGQKLRSESEMAQVKNRTGEGYAMKFMLSIATGTYSSGAFSGNVTATIHYLDSGDTSRTKDIDVIASIAEYNGTMTASTGKDSAGKTNAVIDTTSMLRANHVDRFYFVLDDIKQIQSVTFRIRSDKQTTWTVNEFNIYRVIESGLVLKNASGEVQRGDKLEHFCRNEGAGPVQFTVYEYQNESSITSKTVNFNSPNIVIDDNTGKTHVDREPQSENDQFNLYVYLTDDPKINIDRMGVDAVVEYYGRSNGAIYKVTAKDLNVSKKLNMLYVTGIDVSGFSGAATLMLDQNRGDYARVKYAVIQHLRDGVTIGSYYFDYASAQMYNQKMKPSERGDVSEETQKVVLRMPLRMESVNVGDGRGDIAVAIRYRTSNDVSGTVYESRYAYISDDESIGRINAGDQFEFVFHEDYVSEIVGILILGTNMPETTLPNGYIVTSTTDRSDIETINSMYSLEGVTVLKTLQSYACYGKQMLTMRLTLTGGSSSIKVPDKITAELKGVNAFGADAVFTVDDIVPFISKGALDNDICEFALSLDDYGGIERLDSVRLTPAGSEDGMPIAWYVNSAEIEWTVSKSSDSARFSIKNNVTSDGLLIDIGSDSVMLSANIYDATEIRNKTGNDYIVSSRTFDPNKKDAYINLSYLDYCTLESVVPYKTYTYELEYLSGPQIFTIKTRNGVCTVTCSRQAYEEDREDEGDVECYLIVTSGNNEGESMAIPVTTTYAKRNK